MSVGKTQDLVFHAFSAQVVVLFCYSSVCRVDSSEEADRFRTDQSLGLALSFDDYAALQNEWLHFQNTSIRYLG
jgi:hypothetical protein